MNRTVNMQPSIKKIELDELEKVSIGEGSLLDQNIDLVKDVKVNLEVFVGGAEITIDKLFSLSKGDIVALDKDTRMPLEVRMDGKPIATGSLVAVGDNFGVQIHSIRK